MAQIDISVARFQIYRQRAESRYAIEVVNGALLLDLIENVASISYKNQNASTNVAWSPPVNGVVNANASQELLPPNADRTGFIICNLDPQNWIYLNLNAEASSTSAIYIIQPGQTLLIDGAEAADSINAIASADSINVTYRTIVNG